MELQGEWMQTYSGRRFYPRTPAADQFTLEDLAAGMASERRFGGQGRIELHYSVAEHCYHGAMYFLRRKRYMEAVAFLFHDAAEGLLKDIPRPVKKAIGHGYEVAEALLTIVIERKFGLREWASTVYEAVKEVDNRILLNERAVVLRTPMDWGPAWEKVKRLEEEDFRPRFWPPEEAMRQWIAAAEVFAEDYPELLKLPKEA